MRTINATSLNRESKENFTLVTNYTENMEVIPGHKPRHRHWVNAFLLGKDDGEVNNP